ncbi:MAG: hypothetical protein QOD84_283, partial [Acidobacteriaceae bacterium]
AISLKTLHNKLKEYGSAAADLASGKEGASEQEEET